MLFHADESGQLVRAEIEEGDIAFDSYNWNALLRLEITPMAAKHMLERGGAELFGRGLLEAVIRAELDARSRQ
ncbi:MAG: hypothetical protein GY871_04535 [Actinomycetales bacterium]|nr:hypothetical protein [Actinomycetales bacterium]